MRYVNLSFSTLNRNYPILQSKILLIPFCYLLKFSKLYEAFYCERFYSALQLLQIFTQLI